MVDGLLEWTHDWETGWFGTSGIHHPQMQDAITSLWTCTHLVSKTGVNRNGERKKNFFFSYTIEYQKPNWLPLHEKEPSPHHTHEYRHTHIETVIG